MAQTSKCLAAPDSVAKEARLVRRTYRNALLSMFPNHADFPAESLCLNDFLDVKIRYDIIITYEARRQTSVASRAEPIMLGTLAQ